MGKDNTAQVTDTCTRHITYMRIAHMCPTKLGCKTVIQVLVSHYRNMPESIFGS